MALDWMVFRVRMAWLRFPELRLLPCLLLAGAFVVLPLAAPAQHAATKKPAAATPVAPVPEPVPQPVAPPNMLDQPPAPATVTERNHTLTVKADNSSLTQILHQVCSATGMQLDGLSSDERVFGSFGPAAPREVLTSLLNGTAYNVMMVGDLPNGAPRELLLMRKTGSLPAAPAAGAEPTHNSDDDNPDDSGGGDDSENNIPPSIAPAEPPQPNQPTPPGVRTPQEILQQMQQMRNQQNAAPPQ